MYPVHETFYAWQGEGTHMGRAAFFIRLFGCPVHCPWCDSAGTWHPDFIPTKVDRLSPQDLVDKATAANGDFTVITGGEPAIHDLGPLTSLLKAAGQPVHIETSGAFPLSGEFDWITVSPKWQKAALPENLERANEWKLIIETPGCIERWESAIASHRKCQHVWLHPEWSKRSDPSVLNAISQWVKAHGSPFRAGLQAHKYYNVDQLDPNARPAQPALSERKS